MRDQQARQRATTEILDLIRVSKTDLQPVFDAIVSRATELCRARTCILLRYENEQSIFCASRGFDADALDENDVRAPLALNPNTVAGMVWAQNEVIRVADTQDPAYHDHKLTRE